MEIGNFGGERRLARVPCGERRRIDRRDTRNHLRIGDICRTRGARAN